MREVPTKVKQHRPRLKNRQDYMRDIARLKLEIKKYELEIEHNAQVLRHAEYVKKTNPEFVEQILKNMK